MRRSDLTSCDERRPRTTDDTCETCRHARLVDIGEDGALLRACLYLLHSGERRPCPAGAGCTVYAPRRTRRPGEAKA